MLIYTESMEVNEPLALINQSKNRVLTPLTLLRGVICLVVLILTAFVMLIYFGFITSVVLRFFSVHHSRSTTSLVFASWLVLWPFLFEKINKTKVVFSGDVVPNKERVLLISNHRTEVDWMYIWDLALRKGSLGYIKYVLKSSLMKLPIFGWSFQVLEFIPVHRKWEVDEPIMRRMLSTFKDPRDPLWLAIFPEGTDFTEQKCIKNQKYAAEHGLPILKNVLLPKSKGFFACVEELKSSLDAVYDLTIGYKPRCPFFLDNVFGINPAEVHIHIQRVPIIDIPNNENEVSNWLINTFCLKDKLLSEFYSLGHFPNEGTEKELNLSKYLMNVIAVLTITGACITLTFTSHTWLKIYVLIVCVYLTFATKFNYRPSSIFSVYNRGARNHTMKRALD